MSGQDSARPVAAADPAVLQAAAHCQARPRELRSQHSQHPGEAGGHKGSGGLSRVLVVGLSRVLLRAQVSAAGSGESGSLLTSRK